MAKKVSFVRKARTRKRRKRGGGATDFPFGANVAGGKRRPGGLGGGS
jgi:hypothetical protein